jgi:hypothetical protein
MVCGTVCGLYGCFDGVWDWLWTVRMLRWCVGQFVDCTDVAMVCGTVCGLYMQESCFISLRIQKVCSSKLPTGSVPAQPSLLWELTTALPGCEVTGGGREGNLYLMPK